MPERKKLLESWLVNHCGLTDYKIEPASGDASFRRYFRITMGDGKTHIAMDAPPEHENCEPFVRIAREFESIGLNVPSIREENHEEGFLLIGDLGRTQYLDVLDDKNVDLHYGDAMSALMVLQACCNADDLPAYDKPMLLNEMELFREWLLTKHLGIDLSVDDNLVLDKVFDVLADNALEQPQVCVHRDYHSRNLMITAPPTPGILDFQDAVSGPITYDLVSLVKDCYIEWPREKVVGWAMKYCELCIQSGLLKPEAEGAFLRWFDLMGVQRHLKAAGIFARLNIRDGKDGYLKDIPRTVSYISQLGNEYPELSGLVTITNNIMADLN